MEVKISNLNFYYSKKNKENKLNSINLKILSNTIFGITGKSGSFKSTFIKLINGLLVPISGKIIIGDNIINKKKIFNKDLLNEIIGYVPQDCLEMFTHRKVRDELINIFKYKNKKFNQNNLNEYFDMFNMDKSLLDKEIDNLSNGEKKLVFLISILILDTDILILDEPTTYLDSKNIKILERLLKNLKNNYNKTIIVVSKDVEFINRISDNVVVMYNGSIAFSGNKYDVFKNISLLNEYEIPVPKTIEFSNLVLENKKIKIGYRDEINDLLKDIYRYVR